MSTVQNFYDDLARQYHLIFHDWHSGVDKQAECLDRLIQKCAQRTTLEILDCAAGIGTQSLGLAQRGYRVSASDLSPEALRRLKHEARARQVKIPTQVADFRSLSQVFQNSFDLILACDNALPHLLTESDYAQALREMHKLLRPKGMLLISQRDYDDLLQERPEATPPRRTHTPDGQRVYFQLWDWDGPCYTLDFFILQETQGRWQTHQFQSRYRAWTRQEISELMASNGFENHRWLRPEESFYYQPILLAWKD